MSESIVCLCPHCQQPVQIADPGTQQQYACPHCSKEFVAPVAEPETDRLDSLRIRQLSGLRRATSRARSHAIIAAACCAAAAVELAITVSGQSRNSRWHIGAVALIAVAVCLALAAVYLARRAIALHREMQH